ncbi:MAG: hypothetical protein ACLS7Z_02575 [Christensenellales bacterium]
MAARHSTALPSPRWWRTARRKLFEQVRQFHPKIAALSVEPKEIPADIRSCQWMFGETCCWMWCACDADDVLVSVVAWSVWRR